MEREIEALKERIEYLEDALISLQKQHKKHREAIDYVSLIGGGFFGLFAVLLIGVKIELGYFSFGLPPEVVAKLLEVAFVAPPAIAGGVWAVKRGQRREG